MVRLEVNASGESPRSGGVKFEVSVTVNCSGLSGAPVVGLDRRIANTRDRKPVWVRPRRGVREGAPAARQLLYRARGVPQTPVRQLVGCRADAHRDVGVLVGPIARADPVVAVERK